MLFSCDNSSLEQKKKRVDELKNSLVEIYTEIDNLEKEISEFDSTFNNKNYELVSTISPYSGTFSHEISLRGNIQSNMNILIVPEVMGQVDKIYVEEGETVWLCPCPSPWSQTYEYGPPFPPLARHEILTLSP